MGSQRGRTLERLDVAVAQRSRSRQLLRQQVRVDRVGDALGGPVRRVSPVVVGQQPAVGQQARRRHRPLVVGGRVPLRADDQHGRDGAVGEGTSEDVLVPRRPRAGRTRCRRPGPQPAEVLGPPVRRRGPGRPRRRARRVEPVGAQHALSGLEGVVVREVPAQAALVALALLGQVRRERLHRGGAADLGGLRGHLGRRLGEDDEIREVAGDLEVAVGAVERAERGAHEVGVGERDLLAGVGVGEHQRRLLEPVRDHVVVHHRVARGEPALLAADLVAQHEDLVQRLGRSVGGADPVGLRTGRGRRRAGPGDRVE